MPAVFSSHPAHDGFSLHIKAICLFHRVNKFVRLAKAKRSMGGAELDFRVTRDFQSLDETIQDFLYVHRVDRNLLSQLTFVLQSV
jgi:hypothetical protein